MGAEELLTQESNESDFRIHTQNLSGGIYFLVIFRDGKRMDTKKVILH